MEIQLFDFFISIWHFPYFFTKASSATLILNLIGVIRATVFIGQMLFCQSTDNIKRNTTNLSKAHVTHDSLSSCCLQVVQVYLQPCRHNSLMNVHHSQKLQKKTTKPPYFRSSRSFKVIDVDTVQKLVNSACSDKQYVFIHLQLFLR